MRGYVKARYAPLGRTKMSVAEWWEDAFRWLDIIDSNYGIRQFDPTGEDHIYRLK